MSLREQALTLHKEWKGKIEVISRSPIDNKEALSIAYTPGVAEPCLEIQKDISLSYEYTRKWNLVAVITDGSAVLGLGDIGPEAGMPVMEGKCVLFKEFADVDAFPLCIKSKNVDEIVNTIKLISGSFGGINLEDISAPRCFEIEKRLKKECNIPVFHDDQHGTAIVTLAAMINAFKLVKKDIKNASVIINGSGAAGTSVAKLLMAIGIKNIIVCDKKGALCTNRNDLDSGKYDLAKITNPDNKSGNLAEVIKGADVFIGVSAPNLLTQEMVQAMAKDSIVFAMANPIPEIMPNEAKAGGARIIGTGRSDFPNQINNVLAFPGIFRGALDVRATDINEDMKIAASLAIASLVSDNELNEEYIIPAPFDKRVSKAVAEAVAKAARDSGVARK